MKHLTITLILLTGALSAQDCVDDVADAYIAIGQSCDTVINTFGVACSAEFASITVEDECPLSCNNCPGVCDDGVCSPDETSALCPSDCPVCDDAPVCLNILNVDATAGTLDIHMANQEGCTYCSGGLGGDDKVACTDGGGIWSFDATMDVSTCAGVCTNSLDPDDTIVSQYFNAVPCKANGLCSDSNYSGKTACEDAGICSDDSGECSAGTCSGNDTTSDNVSDCENADEGGGAGIWTSEHPDRTTCEAAEETWTVTYPDLTTCEGAGTCSGSDITSDNESDCGNADEGGGVGTWTSAEETWTSYNNTWVDNFWTDSEIKGSFFDGKVYGIQLLLSNANMTFASVTGGTAVENNFTITVQPNYDPEGDGTGDPTLTMIIGFSVTGAFISAGEGALINLAFTGYSNNSICFYEPDADVCKDDITKCSNIISDVDGYYPIDAARGACYCPGDAVADCADVCGGTSTVDCADVCDGEAVDADADGVCDGDDDCAETAANAVVDADGCSDDQLSISKIGGAIPNIFSISQNYPNPFNPVTSITFDVAEIEEISLIVYDLTGKEVATLASGSYVPGRYMVEWDAVNNAGDGIASGMYIYRYISSDKAITRKMLYLK